MIDNAKFFSDQFDLVLETQRNKRRGKDSIAYECHIISNTYRGMINRLERDLRIDENYAFLVSLPRWREIMATCFEGRKIDHEICRVVIPAAEKILSKYTYNNRKGMGMTAAINQLVEHIFEVSEGYTKPCRIIKLDFKGYFPNALWDYAHKVICEVIDGTDESEERKSYLKWLTMVAVYCYPTEHCELRTPKFLWGQHIEDAKSLFKKDAGIGAAIGRLIWQTAMGLYINDIIIHITEFYGFRLVVFVDDIVAVIPEEYHEMFLGIIPELRNVLAERGVRLNEKKFYDQPYQHGCEFLGVHIKPYRCHMNNVTYGRAIDKIRELNNARYKDIDRMVQTFNSYGGRLKNLQDHKRLIALKDMMSEDWWQWLEWDEKRCCLAYKEGYSVNERLNRKYNLNLKRYDKAGKRNARKRAADHHCESAKQSQRDGLQGHQSQREGHQTGCRLQGQAAGVAGCHQRSRGRNRPH